MPATLTRRHMEPLEQAGSRYAELMRLGLGCLFEEAAFLEAAASPHSVFLRLKSVSDAIGCRHTAAFG